MLLTKPKNSYFIRVIFEKSTGRWQTDKFKGKKLIRSAFGSAFDSAMIHTTMGGPEPDGVRGENRQIIELKGNGRS